MSNMPAEGTQETVKLSPIFDEPSTEDTHSKVWITVRTGGRTYTVSLQLAVDDYTMPTFRKSITAGLNHLTRDVMKVMEDAHKAGTL